MTLRLHFVTRSKLRQLDVLELEIEPFFEDLRDEPNLEAVGRCLLWKGDDQLAVLILERQLSGVLPAARFDEHDLANPFLPLRSSLNRNHFASWATGPVNYSET